MRFPTFIPAVFIQRKNRFTADVRLEGGDLAQAYVPTTGRLTGALRPGSRVWLEPAVNPNRKLLYTLALTMLESGGLCSVNAALANDLFEESLQLGHLEAFPYGSVEREVVFGHSRLDFRLSDGVNTCWAEVKSVTYVEDGFGLFPDAPTGRGRKHLFELAELSRRGDRVCAVFIAQREDAARFAPFEAVDPEFAAALRQVHQQGAEVHAYRGKVNLEGITIMEKIRVALT